ncbi:MAG: copper ion binding protein [Clostridium sp.]|nr:copper ion binding protein [Clostridium sp.]
MCECCGGHGENITLNVKGMTCDHCTESVKRSVEQLRGIKSVNANLKSGEVSISFNPNDINVDKIKSAIISAGYNVE